MQYDDDDDENADDDFVLTTGDLYKNVSGSQLDFGSTDFGSQTDSIILYIYISELDWHHDQRICLDQAVNIYLFQIAFVFEFACSKRIKPI